MRPDMQLDYAVFQLTPNRTRCELYIAAQGMTYKLASGLLKPFIAHLSAAEEQLAGGGYTIRLEPPDSGRATWFTKGTMERFVRFASTPEVLERVGAVEMELIEIEEAIRARTIDTSEENQMRKDQLLKSAHSPTTAECAGGLPVAIANLEKPAEESLDGADLGSEEARKQQLLRYLDAQWIMLQKEHRVAFSRAIGAGFNIEQIGDLILFAENFGALRLRQACTSFIASHKKRQDSGLWQEDLKLAAAETNRAEMAFNDIVENYMSSREHSDLQGRVMKHDDFRRASLPGDSRSLMGDNGLEKLTRRGSLEQLTGEFWQVAARMRAAGMMDVVSSDWSSNLQTPKSGKNQPINDEMQAGFKYLGSKNEIPETKSGHALRRGHPIMPAWQGRPRNHFMHNVHALPLPGQLHPSLSPPLGMLRPPQPGVLYPPYHGNPYMAQVYAEANSWQTPPPPIPPLYWSGHLGYNGTVAPSTNELGDGLFQTPQNHGVESTPLNKDGELSTSVQRPVSDLLESKDTLEMVSTVTTQRPPSDLLVRKDTQETVGTSMQTHARSLPVSESIQETAGTQMQLPGSVNQEDGRVNKLPCNVSGEPHAETRRWVSIRSSSPSRRSASPMRRVQIGRSGPKKPGVVNVCNINHNIQNTHNQTERENDERESSGSWSEDNEDSKSDEEVRVEAVRARVQDVIGLFESKKDSSEANVKPFKKESRGLPSQNSVLSRWDLAAVQRDADDPDKSVASSISRKGVSDDLAQTDSGNQLNVLKKKEERASSAEEVMLRDPDRQGADRPKDVHSTAMVADQGQHENRAVYSRIFKADVEPPSMVGSSHQSPSADSFIVFEQPVIGKEAIKTWKMPLNLESEVPTLDDSCNSAQREEISEPNMASDGSKDTGGRSSDMRNEYDMQALATDMLDDTHVAEQHLDEEPPACHDEQEHEVEEMGDESTGTNSKKASQQEVKAKGMQGMLEKRKAASVTQTGKPNPLAEAQLRAEKLRAYKAGLQKSKQEKEEEEKKRIEDLKSQRKERIAARSSLVGGADSQLLTTRQAPRISSLGVNKSSQTVTSQKLSASSLRSSINATASALSPNMPKIKAASTNKLPWTPTGTTKANENALIRSVPSLTELKKESPKATLAVRSSTGSERFSQLKKSLKDADLNSSLNANGQIEEKKWSPLLATVRKGIPPARDIKGESLSVVKPTTKDSKSVSKQGKKLSISPKGVKSLPPKEPSLQTEEVAASVEQIDAGNPAAVEALTLVQESEAVVHVQETSLNILETNVNNERSSFQDNDTTKCETEYAQVRAPTSTDLEKDLGTTADDSICLPDEGKLEFASSDEALTLAKESTGGTSNVASASNTESVHAEDEDDMKGEEAYHAPIAHESLREENSAVCKDERDASNIPGNIPLTEEYNPCALSSFSALDTPSKNLPRLHEAIQQAHSPEFNPGVGRSRKKRADSGSQRTFKDHHAKGFKRLLLLGRKSHRSSILNSADWVSVLMTSEVDDEGEDSPSTNGKSVGIGSAMKNSGQAEKLSSESNFGTSSGKGSRSFFSLSNFRGKSEGKS